MKLTQDDKLVLAEARLREAIQHIRRSRRGTVGDTDSHVRRATGKVREAGAILDKVIA